MSCFFCSSKKHVSHNCVIHKSDEERRKILRLKNCCQSCLTVFEIKSNYSMCLKCMKNQKCYICFSKAHHTVFCPDRFTMPNIYAPHIDKDLLLRFIILLSTEEMYFLFLSLTIDPKFIKLNPFKIRLPGTPVSLNYTEYDFVVSNGASLDYNSHENVDNTGKVDPMRWNKIVFRIEHLEVYYSPLSSTEFLQLLSVKTKNLICGEIEFYPKLEFSEILKNAPNLEIITLELTNVEISNSWPVELLQFSSAAKFKQLSLWIPELNFNVESLADLMRKKLAHIYLYINVPNNKCLNEKKFFKKITNQLSKFFTPNIPTRIQSLSVLDIYIMDTFGCYNSTQYALKNV